MADGGHGGKSFLNREDAIADAGTNSVERNNGITQRFFVNRQGLNEEGSSFPRGWVPFASRRFVQ